MTIGVSKINAGARAKEYSQHGRPATLSRQNQRRAEGEYGLTQVYLGALTGEKELDVFNVALFARLVKRAGGLDGGINTQQKNKCGAHSLAHANRGSLSESPPQARHTPWASQKVVDQVDVTCD